jgi:4-hydroxy-tetrahydrodipicolinate reductase
VRVGVIGCGGRMGRAILAELLAAGDLVLVGGVERPGSELVGQDLGVLAGCAPTGLTAADHLGPLLATSDVVIEFSSPEASLEHARACAAAGRALVVGTTGFSAGDEAALRALASHAPILWSANMSVGVNLQASLAREVARVLGSDWDVEIVEMHHRHKVDAPSGTALALGRAVAAGRGVGLEQAAVRVRDGVTGPRVVGTIGFATLRGGDVVGEHDVIFAAPGERLVLRHIATDRKIFARGALRAARWLASRPAGFYTMADMLTPDQA